MKVRYIPEPEIEAEAYHLLKSFEAKHGTVQGYIIPVDEIAELHLGYTLEIMDLDKVFPESELDVNGFIDFDTKRIAVHSRLEPTENPSYIGRFNSTISHECAHDVMHKDQVIALLNQGDLFSDVEPNQILCKKSESQESIEWQADCFASYLTMPKHKIMQLWKEQFGSYRPITKRDMVSAHFRPETLAKNRADVLVEIYMKDFARNKVGVSAKALRIRLEKMGLLLNNRIKQAALV